MSISSPTLFLEINNLKLNFFVGTYDQNQNLKIDFKSNIISAGMDGNRISNFEKVYGEIKENIFLIEQKFKYTFKEIILILEDNELEFITLTGFKSLNGSQVVRENITYILNSLKSCVDKAEPKKKILHIFNSKFTLDNKNIDNLPIGLFGDLYAHELSFILMNKNDYKNLKTIFDKCNLKIKKILTKSFIKGANTSENYKNEGSFFQITINNNRSRIFFFENNALKFQQDFKFGTDIIVKDISKIISLKAEDVEEILNKEELSEILDEELVSKEFFKDNNYRKIKKKLIFEIALARIKEISELIIFKNVNFTHFNKISNVIYLEISGKLGFKSIDNIFRSTFLREGSYEFKLIEDSTNESMLNTASKLVHYGWNKEAIPVSQPKKSLIRRFFDGFFS